jgi:hypothetical protein
MHMKRAVSALCLLSVMIWIIVPSANILHAQETGETSSNDSGSESAPSDSPAPSSDAPVSDSSPTEPDSSSDSPDTATENISTGTTEQQETSVDQVEESEAVSNGGSDTTDDSVDVTTDESSDNQETLDTSSGGSSSASSDDEATAILDPIEVLDPDTLFNPIEIDDVVLDFPVDPEDLLQTLVAESKPDFTVSFNVRDFVIRDSVPVIIFDLRQTPRDPTLEPVVVHQKPVLDIPDQIIEQIDSLAAPILDTAIPEAESVEPLDIEITQVTPEVQEVIDLAQQEADQTVVVPGVLETPSTATSDQQEGSISAAVSISEAGGDTVEAPIQASPDTSGSIQGVFLKVEPVSFMINGVSTQYVTQYDETNGTLSFLPDISQLEKRSFVVDMVAKIDGQESGFQVMVDWLPAIEVQYQFEQYSVLTRFETQSSLLKISTTDLPQMHYLQLQPEQMPLGANIALWENNIIWRSLDNKAWSIFDISSGGLSSMADDPRIHQDQEPEYTLPSPINIENVPPLESLPVKEFEYFQELDPQTTEQTITEPDLVLSIPVVESVPEPVVVGIDSVDENLVSSETEADLQEQVIIQNENN